MVIYSFCAMPLEMPGTASKSARSARATALKNQKCVSNVRFRAAHTPAIPSNGEAPFTLLRLARWVPIAKGKLHRVSAKQNIKPDHHNAKQKGVYPHVKTLLCLHRRLHSLPLPNHRNVANTFFCINSRTTLTCPGPYNSSAALLDKVLITLSHISKLRPWSNGAHTRIFGTSARAVVCVKAHRHIFAYV